MRIPGTATQKEKDRKAKEDAILKEQRELISGYAQCAATPNGIQVLRHLRELCGHGRHLTGADSNGDVNIHNLVYTTAQSNLWLDIRRYLSYEVLIAVELTPPVVTSTTNEDDES